MPRFWFVILAGSLSLAACADPPKDDTGGDATEGYGPHPFMPDKYDGLWQVGGCEDGKVAVYRYAEGRMEPDGTFSGVEGWYWFFGTTDEDGELTWEDDCMDRFTMAGSSSRTSVGSQICYQCEQEFSVTYIEDESNEHRCGVNYGKMIFDDSSFQNSFTAMFLFDTHTVSGQPNQEGRMLVIAAFLKDSSWVYDSDWATGYAWPDVEWPEDPMYGPYTDGVEYEWRLTAPLCVSVGK